MAESSRRFPPPWRADKIAGGYVVRDANGQAFAYVYSPRQRSRCASGEGADHGRSAADCPCHSWAAREIHKGKSPRRRAVLVFAYPIGKPIIHQGAVAARF